MHERPAGPPVPGPGREERRVLAVTTGIFASAFAVASAVQSDYVYGAVATGPSAGVWTRVAANALAVLAVLLVWRQDLRRRTWGQVAGVLLAAALGAAIRVVLQVRVGVYDDYAWPTTAVELISGFVVGFVSAGFGTWAMLSRRHFRQQAAEAQRLAVERAFALRALEDEELRVRRDVAEGLHATVQQRLVLAVMQAAEVARRLRAGTANASDARALDEVCARLDQVREQDVRGMSRLLYPDQLEVGLVPAVRALLRHVPVSVATRLEVDPAVRTMDDPVSPALAPTERLLAVRVVEEGISNALRHASPTSLAVTIGLDGSMLTVAVEDDGIGLPVDAARSGTDRLAERLAVVGGTVELTRAEDGTRLSGRLPVVALTPS